VNDRPQVGAAAACTHCPVHIHRILDRFPLTFNRRVHLILQESHNGPSHFIAEGKKPRSSPPIFGSLGAPERRATLENLLNSLGLRMSRLFVSSPVVLFLMKEKQNTFSQRAGGQALS